MKRILVAEHLPAWLATVQRIMPDDCWNWPWTKNADGYGIFGKRRPHRVIYERLRGPIASGLQTDHLCRNRACANPAHLELVTLQENVRRGDSPTAIHGRATHCPRGHSYSGENLVEYRHPRYPDRPFRRCRECKRQWMTIYNAERRPHRQVDALAEAQEKDE